MGKSGIKASVEDKARVVMVEVSIDKTKRATNAKGLRNACVVSFANDDVTVDVTR